MFAGYDDMEGVDPGEIDPSGWTNLDDGSQHGMSGTGLPPQSAAQPAAAPPPTQTEQILKGVKTVVGAAGETVGVWNTAERVEAQKQISQLEQQKRAADAAYQQQLALLRSRSGFKPSFISQYGIMVIIGGALVIGGLYFLTRKRKRR